MGCNAYTANVEMLPSLVCVNPLITLGKPLLLFGLWWWFPPRLPPKLLHILMVPRNLARHTVFSPGDGPLIGVHGFFQGGAGERSGPGRG